MIASSLLAAAVLVTPALLCIMFLPTLLELKKPRDSGPRLILPHPIALTLDQSIEVMLLPDLEPDLKELEMHSMKPFLGGVLGVLPSLEI